MALGGRICHHGRVSLIPEDPIAEVRSRADIVEVVADVVVLKRSGRNFTGLCPFHNERSPSFNVNPERQIYRCFGCGEGGDVFSFVMKAQHQTFPEALKTLADRYGVQLPDRRPDSDERQHVREANELAAEYYTWLLEHPEHGAEGRAYLEGRGVGAAVRKKFRLGLAPNAWDGLHKHLSERKVPHEVQVAGALARPRQSGNGFYDYFRNRVMFPILNEAGHVVGFGARAIAAGDEPKYLNSPETVLYRKGNLLYGLGEAREAIKARDRALLMEGYMDVITAHAHGFEEAVGVLGTALTPAQARVLLRYTPSRNVVLAFDADRAGQQAAERGIGTLSEVAQGVGLNVTVLAVPAGKDPDAYLRAEGAPAFAELVANAPNLFEFLLERAAAAQDLATLEGRARAVTACVPVLRQIENYVMQEYYVNWISAKLGVRHEDVRLEIGRGLRHNKAPSIREAIKAKKLSASEAERILLYFMVERVEVRMAVREKLANIQFEPVHQVIRDRIEALGQAKDRLGWSDLIEAFQGQADYQKLISDLSFAPFDDWQEEHADLEVNDCLQTLEFEYWQRHLEALKTSIKSGEQTNVDEASRRLMEITQYLKQLGSRIDQRRKNVQNSASSAGEV